jgi:hypothetical protein
MGAGRTVSTPYFESGPSVQHGDFPGTFLGITMQSPSRPGHWKISAVFQQILRGKANNQEDLVMKPRSFVVLLSTFLLLTTASQLQAQKVKVIVDQDARGPATTDMQSILIFLQSDKFDVLGITTVSGDQ